MPFVTKLRVQSGDRHLLEDTVTDIKEAAARKGAQLKGPHPKPPEDFSVPQSKQLSPDGDWFNSWNYTVFTRTIEIIGHDEFAREVSAWDFPDRVRCEATVEQRRGAGWD